MTRTFVPVLATCLALAVLPSAAEPADVRSRDAFGRLTATEVTLGNGSVERRWSRDVLATTLIRDRRTERTINARHRDFTLILAGVPLASDVMTIRDVALEEIPSGGVRARFTLDAGVARVVREVGVYPGIAGFASKTVIEPVVPLSLSGYTLDEVAVGAAAPTIHAFRAGADWRDLDWAGPPLAVGDPHGGDWRETATAPSGAALEAPGEWLSLASAQDESVFMVMERRDYASSRMGYDGAAGRALVDLSRDVVYLGPFEEDAHAENPAPGPARHRTLTPGRPLALETVFTGLGRDADDEPWQFSRYLTEHRLTPYPKAVTFNTNEVDANERSTGAKDDVDLDRLTSLAAAARAMGVETFVLDDGWQARSGDWCPDAWPPAPPECQDPRWDGTATSKFRPRFPDATFAAVREVLAGDPGTPADDMALGLWMTPMAFHPRSLAYETSPSWACAPVGHATAAANSADPNGGSNEAGIGLWNPEAIGDHPDGGGPTPLVGYIEGRIRRAVETYGARYFKFDFLVWVDCGGTEPADAYAYRDSFVAMLDRLQADYDGRDAAHPLVTFQIDETNDYRMFPFESVARGPSWFQNGGPPSRLLLHNLWSLAPHVPGFSLGQHALRNSTDLAARGIDYLMAVALPSHITFWTRIDTALTAAQRAQIRRWTDFYKAHRETLATFAYPLLSDPILGGWTALQPWNPDEGTGWLLAYRQEDAANATQAIPLRGVPDGTYELTAFDPALSQGGVSLGQRTAAELRAGLEVAAAASGYRLIRIERMP